MSDLIRQSQDANAVFSRNTDMEPVDLMATPIIGSIGYSCAPNKQYALPTSTPAFNTIIEFELPKAYLSDMYVVFDTSALSGAGNYCVYPGLAIIQRVELMSGTETLQQFDYQPVTHMCLSRLNTGQITQILESAGGTSFASGTCIAPLPLFFTRFGNPGKMRLSEFVEPFNNRLVNGKLRLRLTLRTATACSLTTSAQTATLTARLYYLSYSVPSSIQEQHMNNRESYVYRAYDFVTLAPSSAIAENAVTSFDLKSLVGSLADLFIISRIASSVSANIYYLTADEIDFLELFIDGNSYWRSDQQVSLAFDRLLLSEVPGKASVINSPYVIPFEVTRDPGMYTGALESNGITSFTITLTHSAGSTANVTYTIGSTVNAAFFIDGDSFKRQR